MDVFATLKLPSFQLLFWTEFSLPWDIKMSMLPANVGNIQRLSPFRPLQQIGSPPENDAFITDFLERNPEDIISSFEKKIVSANGLHFGNYKPLWQENEEKMQDLFLKGAKTSSYSEIITKVDLDLGDVAEQLDKAGKELEKVKADLEKDNIWLTRATKKYLEAKKFLGELCIKDEEFERNKRFIFVTGFTIFTLISAVLFTGGIAAGTTLGTLEAVGYFGSTKIDKQELSISEAIVDHEATEQYIFLENDLKLQNESREIAKKMEIFFKIRNAENKCSEVENALSVLMKGLWTMLDPNIYTYGEAPVLKKAIEVNADGAKIQDARKYGLTEPTILLRLSSNKAFVLKSKKEQTCSSTSLRTSFRTVNPNLENIGLPTESPFKFKVGHQKYMWINPSSFLPQTRFRPEQSFSFQRTILSDGNIEVFPYNNTLLIIKSEGRFKVTFVCPNGNTTQYLFKHPILRVRADCQVLSRSLNISSYKIESFRGSVDSLIPDTFLNHTDSFVLYHKIANFEIDEAGLRSLIKEIHEKGKLRNHLEMEKLSAKESLLFKAGEKVMKFFEDAENTLIIAGFSAIVLVVDIIVVVFCIKCIK